MMRRLCCHRRTTSASAGDTGGGNHGMFLQVRATPVVGGTSVSTCLPSQESTEQRT